MKNRALNETFQKYIFLSIFLAAGATLVKAVEHTDVPQAAIAMLTARILNNNLSVDFVKNEDVPLLGIHTEEITYNFVSKIKSLSKATLTCLKSDLKFEQIMPTIEINEFISSNTAVGNAQPSQRTFFQDNAEFVQKIREAYPPPLKVVQRPCHLSLRWWSNS